jgi:hypothetical protein
MTMKNQRTNPIAATVLPLQGKQLPSDWKRNAPSIGAAADADYQHRIENAWRQPMSTKPSDIINTMRDARLAP